MSTIILVSRPNDEVEYNQFRYLQNLFDQASDPFNYLISKSSESDKFIVLRRDEWDDDDSLEVLDSKHIMFIENIIKDDTNILLIHNHDENVLMADKIKAQYKIKYTTVKNTKILSINVEDNAICIINNGKETIYQASELVKMKDYLLGLCSKTNKLETALEFLHKCLVSIPPLPENIDKDYQGNENEGSIGALYDNWKGSSPDKKEENLSVLRNVVIEWAEK